MLLTALHMLYLIPRRLLQRLLLAALVGALLIAFSAPATAKVDPRVKRVKKELVRLETLHDDRLAQLERLGGRWDELEEQTHDAGLTSFVLTALGAVEQAHIETAMIDVRVAIDEIEKERDRAIRALEKIVLERQEKQMLDAGLAPAMMPSINVSGSLVTYSADWEKTAMCESTKRWHINSRYDGGLQFDPITWIEFGGAEFARYAYQATKLEQIAVAERVLAIQGPKAWPICFTPLPVDAEG